MFNGIPIAAGRPKDGFTRFAGGLNQETPGWTVPPGMVRRSLNYEVATEDGYRDVAGYERFDGAPKPSDASFTILDVTISGSIDVGDTVTGADTGATGYVIASATYPENAAQAYLVLTKVTGTFDDADENLEVAATPEADTDAEGYADDAPTPKLKAQYKNLAADNYRADIAAVTGEGEVWGGFTLGSLKYAIRNKSGGVTAGLYKSDASGWTEIDLGEEVAFTSGGAHELLEGDTITGDTSTETAVVERIQITSGSWSGGDAAGWLTLSAVTGTFQAETLNEGANTNVATIGGDTGAITLEPSGQLDHDISKLANPQGADRVYGADGVNYGWEFDGSVFALIRTGMTDDTPDHVIVHKHQLFFAFDGSAQHSGLGNAMRWRVITGAGEIAPGATITGFQIEPGAEGNASLLIACRQRLFMLYGNDVSSWNLVRYRQKVGAYRWTLQQIAYTLFLDDRGITDLRTSQAFGNFDHSSLSNLVRDLVNTKKPYAVASCVVRDKNQYRLFFSDKTALYVTMAGAKLKGIMPVTLDDQPTTVWSEEDENGNEEVFFGGDNGFVYQMERGTSFDGEDIYAYLYTHFDHGKAIQWGKTYHGPVTLEGRSTGYGEFSLGYELDYGSADVNQPDEQAASIDGGGSGSSWDSGLVWDVGLSWDDNSVQPTIGLDLRGEGRNIAWGVIKESDYFDPVLLTGVHYRYLPRVQTRG